MPSVSQGLDRRAFSPSASVFVSANAGAGKTNLLVRRVLSLLLHGVPPGKILCITFTKAAAAEMDNRVLKELGAWVMADDAKLRGMLESLLEHAPDATMMERARSLFAMVLEAPVPIRVETIHGFCQSMLRRFPLEAGITPHFAVMDARSEQEMLQEARLRLFNTARDGDAKLQEAIWLLARTLSESSFNDLLAEIVSNKRKFRTLFRLPGGPDAAIEALWRRLEVSSGASLQSLIGEHFAYDEMTLTQLRQIAGLLLAGESATDLRTGQGLADWLASPDQRPDVAERYMRVFLTEKDEPRVVLFTKKMLTDPKLMTALLQEQERVARFCDQSRSLDIATLSTHVLHIARKLLETYDELKQTHAQVDYDDLILTACDLLERAGMAPWVLFKLDGGIDHVLVDEAQDTSPEQWRIIGALTDEFFAGEGKSDAERSLFIVGDEKQSIFSFQGADVAALGRMHRYFRQRIEDAQKTALTVDLIHSFRSTGEVLAAVDAVFAQPHARAGLMFRDGDLTHIPTRLKHGGLVELWPLVTPSEEENAIAPATQLARTVADTIHGWLESGAWLEAKDRPVAAGDIMILLRSRSGLADRLVRALKRRGVPVAGADRMILSGNLAVQDLMALGQCLLLPEDDLTLAALLKSPIFAISEEQLFTLAYGRGKKNLWERLGELAETPPFAAAYELLTDLRARADFISPYELYAYLLDTRGARRRFTGRMGEEYGDPIDEFLTQALLYERGHIPSLQGFLHWLNSSESEIKRDMEQARDAVRIMTVHGAKGLQAPIVILPDTTEPPRQQEMLFWHDDEHDSLPLWPRAKGYDNLLCRKLRLACKDTMLAEYRRLLYVALTRAEDRLYICGASGRQSANEQSWYSLVKSGFSVIAAPCETPLGEGLRIGALPESHPERRQYRQDALASPSGVSSFAFLTRSIPDEPVPPRPLVPSRLSGDEPASASPLAGGNLYRRGALIHKLLQHLPAIAPDQREAAARRLLANEFDGDCLREALAVIDAPDCAFLFAPGSLAEVPVAGSVMLAGKNIAVAGQIDRLHVGEREIWIADFKSSRLPPQREGDVPPLYLRQLALYKCLLKTIYPDKTVRCALVWTAAARVTVLDDALLDEARLSAYI
jgi:ATP-dependent helicase/nuclease subunit A